MTTTSIDKIRFKPQGSWTGSTSYAPDDIVTYKNSVYACKTANANVTSPDLNSVEWTKLGGTTYYAGEWSNSTAYTVGDIVSYEETCPYNNLQDYKNEHTYICIQAHTNKSPRANSSNPGHGNHSNTSYWSVMSSGVGNGRDLFLGAVNEGYIPPYKKLWDGLSCATPNAINTMIVTNTGSGYTSTPTINISGGGGSGANAFAVVNSSGYLVDVILTDPGSGYTSIPTITVEGGGGASAVVTCNVTTVAMNNGVGDSNGEFKTPGTHTYVRSLQFINRRFGLTYFGYEGGDSGGNYWGSGVNKSAANHSYLIETPFTCLDYLEGVLPTPDGQYPKIIQVETNGSESIVLFNNGEVHCLGYNGNGNKGEGTTDNSGYAARAGYWNQGRAGATSVLRGKRAIRVATTSGDVNESHSMYALIQNPDGTRTIYAWGYNGYGQLGQGNTTALSVPTPINFNETTNGKICEIWAAGGNYGNIWILTSSGKLFTCGYNGYGQLGDGTATNRTTIVEIQPQGGTGSYTSGWTNYTGLGQDLRIKKFSCGYAASVGSYSIVTRGGYLLSWGYNAAGVGYLGHGFVYNVYIPLLTYTGGYSGVGAAVTSPPATSVGELISDAQNVWNCNADGTYSCIFLARGNSQFDNTLYSVGYNGYYNLGDNTTTAKSTFVNVKINNDENATNVIDLSSGFNNNYNSHCFKRYTNQEWYFGGYNNFTLPIGHQDTYNARQAQDPNYTASNYRYKNNGQLAPGSHNTSIFRHNYGSSTKNLFQFDLNTGIVYRQLGAAIWLSGTNNSQTPSSTMHPLPYTGL